MRGNKSQVPAVQQQRETYTIYLRSNIRDPIVYISFADRIFVGEKYKLNSLRYVFCVVRPSARSTRTYVGV